jgi:hypothetical protein
MANKEVLAFFTASSHLPAYCSALKMELVTPKHQPVSELYAIKVKLSLLQAVEAYRVVRCSGSHIV